MSAKLFTKSNRDGTLNKFNPGTNRIKSPISLLRGNGKLLPRERNKQIKHVNIQNKLSCQKLLFPQGKYQNNCDKTAAIQNAFNITADIRENTRDERNWG